MLIASQNAPETMFKQQMFIVQEIRSKGGILPYLSMFGDAANDLFTDEPLTECSAVCMDERVPRRRQDFGSAGSLACMIYLHPEGEDAGWQHAMRAVMKANIIKVIGHDNCGGMKAVYEQLNGKGHHLSSAQLNQFTRSTINAIAEKLSQLTGRRIETCHHVERKMYHSKQRHVAVAAFFSGVKYGFNPNRDCFWMPLGYLLHPWAYDNKQIALNELRLAVRLSLDSYPDWLTAHNPFYICVIGSRKRGDLSESQLRKMAEPLVSEFEGKVIVDGFSFPFDR